MHADKSSFLIKHRLDKALCIVLATAFALISPSLAGKRADMAASMLTDIRSYHENTTPNGKILQVVYFVPKGVEPQKNYETRLNAILLEIQNFIREGMQQNGFGDMIFPLELENGKVRMHFVTGASKAKAYNYDSGNKVKNECMRALRREINFDQDFVLIITGMCRQKEDGSYFFYSPYYGASNSNHQKGLCYVVDCEVMDLDLLSETDRKIKYEEHYGTYNKKLPAFISSYIGGIAHELGHGLSLPHNGQTEKQKSEQGTALMGSGNHKFLEERWSDNKGSFLTFASAMRLASHPLFTGSSKGRDAQINCSIEALKFSENGKEMVISGQVRSNVKAYGVIAYADPDTKKSDYDALAWAAPVKNGAFTIAVKEHIPGETKLHLTFCHVNGDTTEVPIEHYPVNERGVDIVALNDGWLVSQAEQVFMKDSPAQAVDMAMAALPEVQSELAKRKLNHLLSLSAEPKALNLDDLNTPTACLSDAIWASAKIEWGHPCRNHYYFSAEEKNGLFLELDGTFHEKGLYAHAKSNYVFDLNKRWKTFRAVAGLQKGVPEKGSAVFIIKGDGKELYRSDLLTGTTTVPINIEVGHVDRLELITESGKRGNAFCWSIWGSPMLHR